MGGEEGAQLLGQKFGQRISVRHQPHLTAQTIGIFGEVAAHPFRLLQQQARVAKQGMPGLGGLNALALAVQQRSAERGLHITDARARRRNGQMHALGAAGDAAGLDHVEKQPQIGQIETHRVWEPSGFTKSSYA